MKRVIICGPESTGKTTLAKNLALQFQTVAVPEYCRIYLDKKQSPLTLQDVLPIAEGQRALEKEFEKKANTFLIGDTDIRQTLYYSQHYYGSVPQALSEMVAQLSPRIYLLLFIDVPWIADDQRDRPQHREEMFKEMEAALREAGCSYFVISGSWKERWENALAIIQRV